MIELLWKQLRYDIEQQTYRLAEMRMADGVSAEKAEKSEIDESESLNDLALRWTEEGCALLSSILKDKLEASESVFLNYTDALDYQKVKWIYKLKGNVDEQVATTLMHAFVVAYVLHKWAKVFSPNEVGTFANELSSAKQSVLDSVFFSTPKKQRRAIETDMYEPEITIE